MSTSRSPRRAAVLCAVVFALVAPTLSGCIVQPQDVQHALDKLQQKSATRSDTYTGNTTFADLRIGNCVDDLAALDYSTILGLDVVDCAQPHDSEVYALPELTGTTYPSDADLTQQADDACYAAFAAYAGVNYEESALDYDYYTPTKQGWLQDHDRVVTCVVFHPDNQTTGSIKGSAEIAGISAS
jgi:hypothetical protein